MTVNSGSELIDFALKEEREGQNFYRLYAKAAEHRGFQALLGSIIEMERTHEKKLLEMKELRTLEQTFPAALLNSLNIKISADETVFSPEMEYRDFLTLLISREETAEQLYRQLSSAVRDQEPQHFFTVLAAEERKHKDWLQQRYDIEMLSSD